jgi:hypothetical protein
MNNKHKLKENPMTAAYIVARRWGYSIFILVMMALEVIGFSSIITLPILYYKLDEPNYWPLYVIGILGIWVYRNLFVDSVRKEMKK